MNARLMTAAPPPPQIPGFQLHECLGEGSQSIVYRATRADTAFALKIAKLDEKGPEPQRHFIREAATMARIRHRVLPRLWR